MEPCCYADNCSFMANWLKNTPATAKMVRKKYCEGNSPDCARHMMMSTTGSSDIPSDLLPNQREKVSEILGRNVLHPRAAGY